jgi:aminopeptidase
VAEGDRLLEPEELRRYADAIVKASLGVSKGETLVVQADPQHRELAVECVAAGYRAGAALVELQYRDPLADRARLLHGSDAALGAVSPWAKTRMRELSKPSAARAAIIGGSAAGYLDGVSLKRLSTDIARTRQATYAFSKANLDMRNRWTGAGWPTDDWAALVYPELSALAAKRRLARDILWFCRLTDEDGKGTSGWLKHVRAVARRSAKLTRLELRELRLRGPGTDLRVKLVPETLWLGGQEQTPTGLKIAPNVPTEETYTTPDAAATEGVFACTVPLAFQGRVIDGLRGEFRGGRLARLDAARPEDRKRVAAFLDSDSSGGGRRLGEVALVDATSRIGQSGRTYYETLSDENAAAHIAFGAGFGTTRTLGARGVNRARVHLDVMIGSPDFEVTGIDAKGKRVAVISDGRWAI